MHGSRPCRSSRAAALALTAAVGASVAASTLGGPAAAAATPPRLGGVAWSPAKGNAETLVSITTERGCAAGTKRVSAVIRGKGFPSTGEVLVNPTALLVSTTGPMTLPLSNAFVVYAQRYSIALSGKYQVTVRCGDRFGVTSIGDFTTSMTWKTPGGSPAKVARATFVAENTAEVAPVQPPGSDSGIGEVPVPQATTSAPPAPAGAGSESGATPSPAVPAGTAAAAAALASDDSRGWWWLLTGLAAIALAGGAWWYRRLRGEAS